MAVLGVELSYCRLSKDKSLHGEVGAELDYAANYLFDVTECMGARCAIECA